MEDKIQLFLNGEEIEIAEFKREYTANQILSTLRYILKVPEGSSILRSSMSLMRKLETLSNQQNENSK